MEIKISRELNIIINFARDEAMRTGSYGISPDHLMLGIIRHRDNAAADALLGLGVDLEMLKQSIAHAGAESSRKKKRKEKQEVKAVDEDLDMFSDWCVCCKPED